MWDNFSMLPGDLEKTLKNFKRGDVIEIVFNSGGFIISESFYYVNPSLGPRFDTLEVFKRRLRIGEDKYCNNEPILVNDIYTMKKANSQKSFQS